MTPHPQPAACWTLDGSTAHLRHGTLDATIDLKRPQLGLQLTSAALTPIAGNLLALSPSEAATTWPAEVVDAYVRGPDLVATYHGNSNWPYAPQVYWSALRQDDPAQNDPAIVASLALVVSIQTNLLDTHPRIVVESTLAAEEIVLVSLVGDEMLVDSHGDGTQALDPRATACGLLWRFANSDSSYAEIMPKSDFRALSIVRTAHTIASRWELFAEFLEKGVIRRARFQSLFLPRENDVQLVAESCQAIESRPLPLTT